MGALGTDIRSNYNIEFDILSLLTMTFALTLRTCMFLYLINLYLD